MAFNGNATFFQGASIQNGDGGQIINNVGSFNSVYTGNEHRHIHAYSGYNETHHYGPQYTNHYSGTFSGNNVIGGEGNRMYNGDDVAAGAIRPPPRYPPRYGPSYHNYPTPPQSPPNQWGGPRPGPWGPPPRSQREYPPRPRDYQYDQGYDEEYYGPEYFPPARPPARPGKPQGRQARQNTRDDFRGAQDAQERESGGESDDSQGPEEVQAAPPSRNVRRNVNGGGKDALGPRRTDESNSRTNVSDPDSVPNPVPRSRRTVMMSMEQEETRV